MPQDFQLVSLKMVAEQLLLGCLQYEQLGELPLYVPGARPLPLRLPSAALASSSLGRGRLFASAALASSSPPRSPLPSAVLASLPSAEDVGAPRRQASSRAASSPF